MISVEIEKEINQENKVLLGCTLRQLLIVIATGVLCIVTSIILKWNMDLILYPIVVYGGIAGAFGWYRPNGQPFEKKIIRGIKNVFYGGSKRKYKTKNQYVIMVNAEYKRRAAIDMQDKKIAKQIKKEKKQKPPKSKYKALV